jgi:hypothetical protein
LIEPRLQSRKVALQGAGPAHRDQRQYQWCEEHTDQRKPEQSEEEIIHWIRNLRF